MDLGDKHHIVTQTPFKECENGCLNHKYTFLIVFLERLVKLKVYRGQYLTPGSRLKVVENRTSH